MHKKILDFEDYSVNEYGEVFSKRGKPLCQWNDNMGYKQVVLYKNGKRYYKRVHRLVYEAFYGKIKDKLIVNHIDENKNNNNVNNLEVITNAQNIKHFHEYNELKSYDISVYRRKDNSFINRYSSIRSLCVDLDLNRKTVTNIIKGIKKTNNYPYIFVNNKA